MTEVTFDSVMRNHKNWPDNVDFDGMEESYHKVSPIMDKMFFEEYPKHPQAFVMIFSIPDLTDSILKAMVASGIINLNRVWFREYSKEEKEKMMARGLMPPVVALPNVMPLGLARNENDFFVNLFYDE